jgi:hypothetical protein
MPNIRIDTSNLTYKRFSILSQNATLVERSTVAELSLPSGTYTFQQPGVAADLIFDVTPDGLVNYSVAHDSFLIGRGTGTLVVRGFSIILDARPLSHDLLPLINGASILPRDRTHELTLIPAAGYGFAVTPRAEPSPSRRWRLGYWGRASRSRGSSGTSVKLRVPIAEDVLEIVVKDFGPCL